jgi:hypothetical protein
MACSGAPRCNLVGTQWSGPSMILRILIQPVSSTVRTVSKNRLGRRPTSPLAQRNIRAWFNISALGGLEVSGPYTPPEKGSLGAESAADSRSSSVIAKATGTYQGQYLVVESERQFILEPAGPENAVYIFGCIAKFPKWKVRMCLRCRRCSLEVDCNPCSYIIVPAKGGQ